MKRQPNRLAAGAPHGFGGRAIDRRKPITFRLNHRLIEAFEGDTGEYADLGITNLSRIAHVMRTADAELGGLAAVEIEGEIHALDPRTRHLSRAAVRGGIGYVMQCSASPERWADAAPVMRAILGTLRLPMGD